MNARLLANMALAAALAVGASTISTQAQAGNLSFVKCYGVSKAGKNDCGATKHPCQGQSKVDGDEHSWLYLPAGTCKKIVGGKTTPPTE